jgi:hypothetical protein
MDGQTRAIVAFLNGKATLSEFVLFTALPKNALAPGKLLPGRQRSRLAGTIGQNARIIL